MRLIDANIIEYKLEKLIEELEKISDATYHADAFYDTDKHYGRHRDYGHKADGVEIALDEIKAAPTIEERKKGEWIENEIGIRHCCYCNAIHNSAYRNFCPNCGADMREEQSC